MKRSKRQSMKTQSVSSISQQIIDGLFYWDSIAPNWFRLIHRPSMDVVGHCKEISYRTLSSDWLAVRHAWNYQANGKADQQSFHTEAEARQWIEAAAKGWTQ